MFGYPYSERRSFLQVLSFYRGQAQETATVLIHQIQGEVADQLAKVAAIVQEWHA